MSDEWKYLRVTIDIAVDTYGDEPERKRFVKRLLNEESSNGELEDAIKNGWVEIDGYGNVEDHTS